MTIRSITGYVLFTLLLFISTSPVYATPEYGVEYGQSCNLCHVSPAGGGMRTLYGTQFFSQTDLPANPIPFGNIEDFSPILNDRIQIGFDFRTLSYLQKEENISETENSFFTMEGALYLTFALNDKTRFVYEKGLRDTFEAYGLFNNVFGNLSLRAGRFTANYGWYFADHNSYVRSYTGHGLFSEDDGIEVFYQNDNNDFSFSITNATNSPLVDTDPGKGFITRYARRFAIAESNFILGGSWEYRQIGLPSPEMRQGNLFYGMSLSPLLVVGEVDYRLTDRTSLISSTRLKTKIADGYYPYLGYDFYDSNIDYTDGIAEKYSIGIEIIPQSHLGIIPSFEYESSQGQNYTSLFLQLHLWY